MELTTDEVRRFAEACADPQNRAAAQVMLATGASSATGVLARIILADDRERERLIELVRRAVSD